VSTPSSTARLVGVDVARCLALLGMVATHVLEARDAAGELAFAQSLAGGRAAALFAVLAGVSLALITGLRQPVRGRERLARSAGIVVRALLIGFLGLWLGGLDTGIAVILTYYGLLFLLGLPFLGLRAPALFAWAAAVAVVVPLLSQVVRPSLPDRGYTSPGFGQLDSPDRLLSELLLTGYYPVLPWLAYLLVGMALGRLDLGDRRVQAAIAAGGAVLAAFSVLVSRALTARPDVVEALLDGGGPAATTGPQLLDLIAGGMYGTTPTGGPWQWLLVVAPHSATPFDLAHTIGTSCLVIGLALLAVGMLGPVATRAVAIVFGAGTMTLSLYTLHVLMRTPDVPPAEEPDTFIVHVFVLMGVGAVHVALGLKGPLEWAVAGASSRTAAAVRGRPRSGLRVTR
jgi:uncharacterized membrane protein